MSQQSLISRVRVAQWHGWGLCSGAVSHSLSMPGAGEDPRGLVLVQCSIQQLRGAGTCGTGRPSRRWHEICCVFFLGMCRAGPCDPPASAVVGVEKPVRSCIYISTINTVAPYSSSEGAELAFNQGMRILDPHVQSRQAGCTVHTVPCDDSRPRREKK